MAAALTGVIVALVAGLFGILGAIVAGKRDHDRWLREQRLAACVDLALAAHKMTGGREVWHTAVMSATRQLAEAGRLQGTTEATTSRILDLTLGVLEEKTTLPDQLAHAATRVELLGPDALGGAATRLQEAAFEVFMGRGSYDDVNDAGHNLVRAARAALGVR